MSAQAKRLIIALVAVVIVWVATGIVGSTDEADVSITSAVESAEVIATAAEPATAQTIQEPPTEDSVAETPQRFSDLPTISPGELPPEAIDTLELIASGGPYPFSKDDTTFQNREGLLPDHQRGHYREYTVITPGEGDRGARRIVAGADGALYYTSDHYDSFREVVLDNGSDGQ